MPKKVVLVGHCGPDSSYLRMAITSAQRGTEVAFVEDENALRSALKAGVDLVLFNRLLDYGFPEEEGVAVIQRLHEEFPGVKMMLVSNYSDAQHAAVAAGALPGFGKREIGSARVNELLRSALA